MKNNCIQKLIEKQQYLMEYHKKTGIPFQALFHFHKQRLKRKDIYFIDNHACYVENNPRLEEIFKFPCRTFALYTGENINDQGVHLILSHLKTCMDSGLLTLKLPIDHSLIAYLQKNNIFPVVNQLKMIYTAEPSAIRQTEKTANMETVPESEIHNLVAGHMFSRFHADNHFSHEKVNKLFYNWLKNKISEKNTHMRGWYEGSKLRGMVVAGIHYGLEKHFEKRIGEIFFITVKPGTRGKGIGKTLLNEAMQMLIEQGCDHVEVSLSKENTLAQKLYESFGFEPLLVQPIFHFWGDDMLNY